MGRGGGGRLFEARRLLSFSAFGMGAFSRWALVRGSALIRINTVFIIYLDSPVLDRVTATTPGATTRACTSLSLHER